MFDPGQFCLYICGSHHIAVGEVPEVQLDPWLEAPLQRNFINRYRPFFTTGLLIHGGMKVIRRIKVRAVMRTQLDKFNCPALPIGQFATFQARKKRRHLLRPDIVGDVVNVGLHCGRVADHLILKVDRQVNKASFRHLFSLFAAVLKPEVSLSHRVIGKSDRCGYLACPF